MEKREMTKDKGESIAANSEKFQQSAAKFSDKNAGCMKLLTHPFQLCEFRLRTRSSLKHRGKDASSKERRVRLSRTLQ